MANPESDLTKDLKTLCISFVTWSITKACIGGGDAGTVISLALMLPFFNYMHNTGANRRFGSNLLNHGWYNSYRNISNGGAKIYDDIANYCRSMINEAQQPENEEHIHRGPR